MQDGEEKTAASLPVEFECGKNYLHSRGNKGLADAKNASLDLPPYPVDCGPENGPGLHELKTA